MFIRRTLSAAAAVAVCLSVVGSTAAAVQAAPIPIQPAPDGCRSLPVDADPAIGSAIGRSTHGVDGTGVTIGIMSTSFDSDTTAASHEAEDIAAGLLPGPGNPCGRFDPVEVLPIVPLQTTDEGRAMAQLVHGVAPGAHIVFASAGGGTVDDAVIAVRQLADAGADIIVDDMLLADEPYFQESELSVVITDLVEQGIVYLSAAGNENLLGGESYASAGLPIGSWSTTEYRPTACPAGVGEASTLPGPWDCMDFDPGDAQDNIDTLTLAGAADPTVPVQVPLFMQWAEPENEVTGSFAIVASAGGAPGAGDPGPAGLPSMAIELSNSAPTALEFDVSIVRSTAKSDLAPPVAFIAQTDGAEYLLHAEYYRSEGDDTVGPTVFGHNGSPSAITIGAAPFFEPTRLEAFSSFGAVNYYFGPSFASKAERYATPRTYSKPDLVSVDAERTSFMEADQEYKPGQYFFPGTSAATPVAGAVVALGLQARPDLTPEQVRTALTATADPLPVQYGGFTSQQVAGAGLIDAEAFVAAVLALPTPNPAVVPAASGTPALAATGTDAGSALWVSLAAVLAGMVVVRVRRPAPRQLSAHAHTVEKSNRKE